MAALGGGRQLAASDAEPATPRPQPPGPTREGALRGLGGTQGSTQPTAATSREEEEEDPLCNFAASKPGSEPASEPANKPASEPGNEEGAGLVCDIFGDVEMNDLFAMSGHGGRQEYDESEFFSHNDRGACKGRKHYLEDALRKRLDGVLSDLPHAVSAERVFGLLKSFMLERKRCITLPAFRKWAVVAAYSELLTHTHEHPILEEYAFRAGLRRSRFLKLLKRFRALTNQPHLRQPSLVGMALNLIQRYRTHHATQGIGYNHRVKRAAALCAPRQPRKRPPIQYEPAGPATRQAQHGDLDLFSLPTDSWHTQEDTQDFFFFPQPAALHQPPNPPPASGEGALGAGDRIHQGHSKRQGEDTKGEDTKGEDTKGDDTKGEMAAAVRPDSEYAAAEHEEKGEAMKGEAMQGQAMKGEAMKGESWNALADGSKSSMPFFSEDIWDALAGGGYITDEENDGESAEAFWLSGEKDEKLREGEGKCCRSLRAGEERCVDWRGWCHAVKQVVRTWEAVLWECSRSHLLLAASACVFAARAYGIRGWGLRNFAASFGLHYSNVCRVLRYMELSVGRFARQLPPLPGSTQPAIGTGSRVPSSSRAS